MSRLLLVEDEERLARSLMVGFREEGFVVDHAQDGEEALWYAKAGHHDSIVLDIRLPKLSGLDVCRSLRQRGVKTPVLMLTACDSSRDIITGLDSGADDYLTKPFAFEVLLARIRALLRRGSTGTTARLAIADLQVDTASRSVSRAGSEITLGNMEYRLLEYLLLHTGTVQSKARLAAALWDDDIGPESNVIEVLISNLRRKIDRDSLRPLIHTRRGAGYIIEIEGCT